MALYAIGDLHLSLAVNKSMEVFGPAWENYHQRIEEALGILTEDDVLILAGDTSWGMNLEEAEADFRFLDRFPGKKYLIKGNHDRFLKQLRWQDYFESLDVYKEIDDNGRMVCMFHYPIEEWNGYYRNSYMLYGHVHENMDGIKKHPRKFNVGVDVNGFEPKTLDELIANNKK
jgi:predicted phosphohydrolase